MKVPDLQDRLLAVVPDARLPNGGPADDLLAFRFASAAFVPPFMDALMRVVLGADDDGAAHRRLTALAAVLEDAFVDGDEVADALAMRLVHSRLCAQPVALAGVWPYLGERSRQVAGKFLRLAAECDRREAALRAAQPAGAGPPRIDPANAWRGTTDDDHHDQAATGGGEDRVSQAAGGGGLG